MQATTEQSSPSPVPAAPVMDVKPPQSDSAAALAQPALQPVSNAVATPPPEPAKDDSEPAAKKPKQPKPVAKLPKEKSGVAAAIVTAIIVVMALAALAVLAYMKGSSSA